MAVGMLLECKYRMDEFLLGLVNAQTVKVGCEFVAGRREYDGLPLAFVEERPVGNDNLSSDEIVGVLVRGLNPRSDSVLPSMMAMLGFTVLFVSGIGGFIGA